MSGICTCYRIVKEQCNIAPFEGDGNKPSNQPLPSISDFEEDLFRSKYQSQWYVSFCVVQETPVNSFPQVSQLQLSLILNKTLCFFQKKAIIIGQVTLMLHSQITLGLLELIIISINRPQLQYKIYLPLQILINCVLIAFIRSILNLRLCTIHFLRPRQQSYSRRIYINENEGILVSKPILYVNSCMFYNAFLISSSIELCVRVTSGASKAQALIAPELHIIIEQQKYCYIKVEVN